MSFIKYIKDCIHFAKKYPFTHKGIKRIWLRNILYINAQPKYWISRIYACGDRGCEVDEAGSPIGQFKT